jgi:membrane AbrB-like protein
VPAPQAAPAHGRLRAKTGSATMSPARKPQPTLFQTTSAARQWSLLVVGSLLLALIFALARLPAALLLGPMVAGILLGSNGARISVPRLAVYAAQTIVGCLIARSITGDIVHAFLKDWPLLLGAVLVIILTSSLLGWIISRWRVLPGSTAVWGSAPGGASVMMLMAGAFGADARLVAFMQYSRVVLVAAVASLVARFWVGEGGAGSAETSAVAALQGSGLATLPWGSFAVLPPGGFAALPWGGFAATLLIAAGGGLIGMALRIPAGALLAPMALAAVLEAVGLVSLVLPPWLLAISYAFLGWSIGLSFNRQILQHAARALLPITLAIGVMIGVCGALAALLVRAAGIEPLTAYLATSPGGMDSVAIIGAASKVDLSFVMALQVVRLVIVLIVGPPLARFLAQRL